jgi:hypothetical protein
MHLPLLASVPTCHGIFTTSFVNQIQLTVSPKNSTRRKLTTGELLLPVPSNQTGACSIVFQL